MEPGRGGKAIAHPGNCRGQKGEEGLASHVRSLLTKNSLEGVGPIAN